jgi:hypothetical protein
MSIADTCKEAIDLLAVYVGPEMACNQVFAKMRDRMTYQPIGINLDPARVAPLRAVLEHGGRTIEVMNEEFLETWGLAQQHPNRPFIWVGWVPPAWRAPHFGVNSDNCEMQNQLMDSIRDRVLVDWRAEHNNQDMSLPQLRLYLAGMAAHSVGNKIENDPDIETYYDGPNPDDNE